MAVVLVGLPEFFVRTRVVRRKELQRWFHNLLVKKLGVDPHYLRVELIWVRLFFVEGFFAYS